MDGVHAGEGLNGLLELGFIGLDPDRSAGAGGGALVCEGAAITLLPHPYFAPTAPAFIREASGPSHYLERGATESNKLLLVVIVFFLWASRKLPVLVPQLYWLIIHYHRYDIIRVERRWQSVEATAVGPHTRLLTQNPPTHAGTNCSLTVAER